MRLSKLQKIYLAILGLAVAAFLADRFFLDAGPVQPREAEASGPAPGAGPAASSALPPASKAPAEDPGRLSLAERLQALAVARRLDQREMREAFVPAESWLSELMAARRAAAEPEAGRPFLQAHRLTSVLITAGGGMAVVDDKAVRIGQEVDGYRLVRLTPTSAVFQSGEAYVELKLRPEPNAP